MWISRRYWVVVVGGWRGGKRGLSEIVSPITYACIQLAHHRSVVYFTLTKCVVIGIYGSRVNSTTCFTTQFFAKSGITTATYDKPLRRPSSDSVRKCAITPSLIPVNVFVNHHYGDTVWCSWPFRATALLKLFPSIPNVIHVVKLGSEWSDSFSELTRTRSAFSFGVSVVLASWAPFEKWTWAVYYVFRFHGSLFCN